MVLDILVAAVLIAFGVFAIFFTVDSRADDPKLLIVLAVGAVTILAGGWIILSKISLVTILLKLLGLGLVGVGLFLIVGFPDVEDYQLASFGKTGIFVGLVLLILGAYLLLT